MTITEIHSNDDMFCGDFQHYLSCGQQMTAFAERAVTLSGTTEPFILELPCGYGRATRHLVKKFQPDHIHCADIMIPAVDFCTTRFGVIGHYITEPVYKFENIDSEKFDVGLLGSLITHLSMANAESVVIHLFSKVRKGGIGVITTHGEKSRSLLQAQDLERGDHIYQISKDSHESLVKKYDTGEFGFVNYRDTHSFEKKTVEYIGDDYGISLIPAKWIHGLCDKYGLQIIEHLAGGWDSHQDVFFIKK